MLNIRAKNFTADFREAKVKAQGQNRRTKHIPIVTAQM